MSGPSIEDRIRAVKDRHGLAATIGQSVKLKKAGRELVGLCPFHAESTPSFTVAPDKDFYHCFGCGAHGDVIGFVQQQRGCDFMTALAELEGGELPPAGHAQRPQAAARVAARAARPSPFLSSTEAGQIVWAESRPCAASDLPARYLRSRGIDPTASGVLDVVRYHGACPVGPWRRGSTARGEARPAMLTPMGRWSGEPGARVYEQVGLHITFLADDGRGKAVMPEWTDRDGEVRTIAARQMWGEAGRVAVGIPAARHGMSWRAGRWIDEPGELVVAEGLESTLSLMAMHAGARGAFATLSLTNLQGGWLNDGPKDSLKLWAPTPDPDKPPFRIARAGAVVIGIDTDMKGLRDRMVQERPRERPLRRDLTGRERSDLCAALAAAHWRAAFAGPVRIARPPMGMDFNDVAQGAVI